MEWTSPHLLIADDDRDFRESLSEVFQRRGFCTHLACDGCEALEIVRKHSELHLVLLDVHMPRLSGLDALEQMRHVVESHLPCIMMTARIDDCIRKRAAELDTQSLLSKPFTLRDITGTVEDIMFRSYGWSM